MAASHILMIRPVRFSYNPQTAVNNAFQEPGQSEHAQEKAAVEFENFVTLLQANAVDVLVIRDTMEPHTPDAIFPNNWISLHENGTVCLYPMFAENRRHERRPHVIDKIREQFCIEHLIDFSFYEQQNIFLEGTGSMVLDRKNRIAYACYSPRTSREALEDFCNQLQYRPVAFNATDSSGQAIYHTNVMMCLADRYAVICLDSIADAGERKLVMHSLQQTGKDIIEISPGQLAYFAGNMLQVENRSGEAFLVMSEQAFRSLSDQQVITLMQYNKILHSPLDTIETNAGGSARCMMAEIYLKRRND